MDHEECIERAVPWLLVVTFVAAIGCETSNAVITGIPVGGMPTPTGIAMNPNPISVSIAGSTGGVASTGGAGVGVAPAGAPSIAGEAAPPTSPVGNPAGSPAPMVKPPAAEGCRMSKYSLAVRLTIDMSWAETLALVGGSGKLYSWSKLTVEPATGEVSEYRTCGSLAPAYRTTALAGNTMVFQRTPQEAFDQRSMPVVSGGSAVRTNSMLSIDPGPLVLGLTLPDPAGPWPTATSTQNLSTVDPDGDGKPGLTSLMRNDGAFTGSPTSILQTDRIDANYLALRVAYQLTLNDAACAGKLEGTAKLVLYDNLILGCHVKDRGECLPEHLQFIQENRPKFVFGANAVADASVIAVDASCAQVVQTLDVPGP